MKPALSPIWSATVAVFCFADAAGTMAAPAEAVDFARDIGPVLARHCLSCHGPEKQKGGLRLDRREDAFKGGDHGAVLSAARGADALLVQVVEGKHDDIERMPQKADPLSAPQVALLRRWIGEGARWPDGVVLEMAARADKSWWSLQPLRSREPLSPKKLPKGWSHPIDRFVFAALVDKRLTFSPPANRRALIRRVTYDVLGLPPSPEEIEAFLKDSSPDAYEQLVDRLLASPHYGERWGRFWLDVARFGESNGYERNVLYPNAWPYRDYVIRSLNEDKPFDRFIQEQIAGDVIGEGHPEAAVATAFLTCGPYDNVGNEDAVAAAQIRSNDLDDMVRAASEAFLGLTVGCARCHHHKFDPIPQEDYYRLQAAFTGVRHGDRVVATDEQKRSRAEQLRPLEERRKSLEQQRAELETRIADRAKARTNTTPTFAHPKVDPYLTEHTFAAVDARFVRLVVLANDRNPKSAGGVRIDEFEVWSAEPTPRNVALASNGARAKGPDARVAEDFAGAYGADLVNDGDFSAKWFAGSPPVLTLTLRQTERIQRVAFSSDRPRGLPREHGQNTFIGEYRLEVSPDGTDWTPVGDSRERPPLNDAFARERLIQDEITADERVALARLEKDFLEADQQIRAVPPLPTAWAGTFSQPKQPAYLMEGGDPQRKGPTIAPASLSFLRDAMKLTLGAEATNVSKNLTDFPLLGERDGVRADQLPNPVLEADSPAIFELPPDAPEAERRVALARWLTHPANPLTPRVLANRVWQSHFGVGLVDTPSDFGWLGGRPTHPELLDWLARRLIEHGWRLKPLHREILLSQTYRQSSAYRSEAARIDKDARLLWRFPPRRLSAEEIRDSVLAVAGKLDVRPGGPGFRLYRYLEDNVATYVPLDAHGPETYRRAVYHQNPRAARADLLSDFDCPDNAIAAPKRVTTTTPLQALTLLNHPFTLDMARFFAGRLERETGAGYSEAQVTRAFVLVFGRAPSSGETRAAIKLIRQHGLASFCRAQLNANEFIYVY